MAFNYMSYKVFTNRQCDYYPCHTGVKGQYNCMFCYCPLYTYKNCGGDYVLFKGMKDCTNCIIPHSGEDGWEMIQNKLEEIYEENKGTSGCSISHTELNC